MKTRDLDCGLTALMIVLVVCGAAPIVNSESPAQSTFLVDVAAANYEQLPPPPEPLLLRWNFAEGSIYSFALRQTIDSKSKFSDDEEPEHPTRMVVDGRLEMKSQEDHTAKIVLSEVETAIERPGDDAESTKLSHKSQPMVVQGLKEDGTMPSAGSQQDALFRLLFPLPDEPLAVGGSTTTPFQFPVNVFGSPLTAEGSIHLEFTSLVYVRGKTCAQIDFNVSVDDFELPEEIQTTFEFDLSGAGRYFFDIEQRRLVEANVALLTSMAAEFPSDMLASAEAEDEASVPSSMSMSSDILIQLTSD